MGEARQSAGSGAAPFHLADVIGSMTRPELRDALHLFWKEVRVGRNAEGRTTVALVSRGPGGTTALELEAA